MDGNGEILSGGAIGLLQGPLFTPLSAFASPNRGDSRRPAHPQRALLLVLGKPDVYLSNSGFINLANTFYGPAVGGILANA